MLASLDGTRSHPAVELRFDVADRHRKSGGSLLEWVRGLPGRSWNDRRKAWRVTDFGPDHRLGEDAQQLLADAGFDVIVGPDDMPTPLDGLVFTDADRPSEPDAAGRDRRSERRGARSADGLPGYDGRLPSLRGVGVRELGSVNGSTAAAMKAFGVESVYELLHTAPRRYIDLSNPQSVADVEAGEKIAVLGKVTSVKAGGSGGRGGSMSRINVRDSAGVIVSCRFFHADWMVRRFESGQRVILHGKVETWRRDGGSTGYGMTNPLIDVLASDAAGGAGGQGMIPIYPQSAKADLDTWKLHRAAKEAVRRIWAMEDPMAELAGGRALMGRLDAFASVHTPRDPRDATAGRSRLAYDELLRIQLSLLLSRQADAANGAIEHGAASDGGRLAEKLTDSLPFPLTGAQARAVEDIVIDMRAARPMHRLLQGDVGSGKTLVALLALLTAVESRHQGVLMAPTEILASQHFHELREHLDGVVKADGEPVSVALLTNKVTGKARKEVLAGLADGSVDIAVGTHALLADAVTFGSLSLAVVDEQHRFGVEQRAALRSKGPGGRFPDMLVATATPIPRTAVMAVFGDLDVSVLDEMPPGRSPTATSAVAPDDARPGDGRSPVWQDVRDEVAKGRQAFVVCPLVGDSETKAAAAAQTVADMLGEGALAGLRIAVAHGKQKADERAEVMAQFAGGDVDVLVATTVVEVGVNVPNATMMVITSAERFGLAQLHQLRGRVGRGRHPGRCVLVADPRTTDAQARIDAMCATTDGFELSETDLRIRGWGTLLGGKQSGTAADLRVADLFHDAELLEAARADARRMVHDDPMLAGHPEMLAEVRAVVGEDEAAWLSSA